MKLLVTGAAGFVGAAVVQQGIAAGHEVTAVVRSKGTAWRLAEQKDAQIEAIDLRDRERIGSLCQRIRPDVVVHVAWAGVENKARFDRTQITDNIDSTVGLLEEAVIGGARKFIGFGSQGEYGPLNRRVSESDLPQPTTMYGAAKLATYHLSRQIAAQEGIDFAWMRLFSTFGPGDNPGWLIPSIIDQLKRGERVKLTLGTQKWDYLYIDDVARGTLAVASTPGATGVFNLGSGEANCVRSVVEIIRDTMSSDAELAFGAIPFRPDQVMHMEADVSRLKSKTGWVPEVTLEEGLRRTIEAARNRQSGQHPASMEMTGKPLL